MVCIPFQLHFFQPSHFFRRQADLKGVGKLDDDFPFPERIGVTVGLSALNGLVVNRADGDEVIGDGALFDLSTAEQVGFEILQQRDGDPAEGDVGADEFAEDLDARLFRVVPAVLASRLP